MIGNDIIDLKYTRQESDWQRPRFLKKLFTDSEQEMIQEAKHPELLVWLLWSIKESVYKIVCRSKAYRFFTPKKFACTLSAHPNCLDASSISGFGVYNNKKFYTRSLLSKNLIHTTAQTKNRQSIQDAFFDLPSFDCKEQSTFTRLQLKEHYAITKNLNVVDLEIRKNQVGVPFLFYKNEKLPTVISLSHHGRFGGFSYFD